MYIDGARIIKTKMGYGLFGFLGYADQLCQDLRPRPPYPLSHMFSLARDRFALAEVHGRSHFLVEEEIETNSLPDLSKEIEILSQRKGIQPNHEIKLTAKSYRISFYISTADLPEGLPSVRTSTFAEPSEMKWFADNAEHFICLGYLVLCVNFMDKYPVGAYVPEALLTPPGLFGKAEPAVKEVLGEGATESQTYVHCVQKKSISILGATFEVRGSYFSQQEGSVWCCAHAAILSSLRMLQEPDDVMSVHKMNELVGIDHVSRFAMSGLSPLEICKILEESKVCEKVGHMRTIRNGSSIDGLHTMQVHNTTPQDVLLAAYHTVELGLPAIICFSGDRRGHAMTIVGHTFDPSLWNSRANEKYFQVSDSKHISSFAWVDKFIVQDDNFGPYQTVLKSDLLHRIEAVVFPCSPYLLSHNPSIGEALVSGFLVDQEFVDGKKLMHHLQEEEGIVNGRAWLARFVQAVGRGELVLRQTIMKASEYKQEFDKIVDAAIVSDASLPEDGNLIVVEVSIPELYQWNHRRLGEAIILKTNRSGGAKDGPSETLEIMLVRLPGVVIYRKNFDPTKRFWTATNSCEDGNYHRPIVESCRGATE